MAILVGNDTRLLVQGLTGREGSFHGLRNREYGTNLVAGVTPGKGGSDVDGIPIFDTVREATTATGANTSMIFVPPPVAADAILESHDAGIEVIIAITEGIPAMDMARTVTHLRRGQSPALIGPNCPGVISPGKANVGIIPGEICTEGPVGLVSRSGTLTYQIVYELTQEGIGQSTCVGVGGDPIPGSDFIDVLERFEEDALTKLVVLVGEIGGDAEERAAAWVKENMKTPVVAYIAGFTAPPGKRMGHAGAIVSGSQGTAAAKKEALESAGIRVATNPTEVSAIVKELL
jgi:succinyl-CoA synthetase alpha subunit